MKTGNVVPKSRKRITIAIIIIVVISLAVGTIKFRSWVLSRGISPYMNYPSLRPQLKRPLSIRFDPSFYYELKKKPKDLAKILADRWQAAGINRVFYRAYDPRYGAFYHTEYMYNSMGDYGKYDLLEYVLKECHERQIEVYAWLPVLNHQGAWEKNPQWRTLRASGDDYRAKGLQFPICARLKEVKEWWSGFLSDILDHYPEIDGIDLAEPVISWSEGDACFCDQCQAALKNAHSPQEGAVIRAQSLTLLLGDSIALAHKSGKKASITFVQSAHDTGKLFTPQELMTLCGFDLDAVLHAGKDRSPDIICPEFIWQEFKSRTAGKAVVSVFHSEWTKTAVKEFLTWIDSPVDVLIHLEITDFPSVPVDADLLEKSILSAIQGGASGIDIYSSSQMDKKNAWRVLTKTKHVSKKKRCLVLFDQGGGENDAFQVGAMLRHFNVEVSFKPLSQYSSVGSDQYDALFYVGVVSDVEVPKSLLKDLMYGHAAFCWLGFNIEAALGREEISKALGLEFLGVEKGRFNEVHYKDMQLVKKDPWTTVVEVFDQNKCRILATMHGKEDDRPYAVRSGRHFWYFSDVPTSHAIEGGRYLVFSDLLHDILDEQHDSESLALVRIEDVHPLTDPDKLRKIADYLHREKVPFSVSVVPFYVFPEKNLYVGLREKPHVVSALKYMVKKGGTVVMHGTTHQRFEETTSDYEFWDPVNDQPPEGETVTTIREKIETGLKEFWSVGIYPLMWETPHYAGSQDFYSVVEDIFSISMERRQSMNQLGTDQAMPYLVIDEGKSHVMVPENLGYVPLKNQQAEVILEPARKMKVVRDHVASFFFHPFVDHSVLKMIIKSMKKMGFRFSSIGDLPIRVETSFGLVTNHSGKVEIPSERSYGKEEHLLFPGILRNSNTVELLPNEHFIRDITLRRGDIFAAHFIPSEEILRKGGKKESRDLDKGMEVLSTVSNFHGEQCSVPKPMVLSLSQRPFKLEEDAKTMTALFELIGVSVVREHVSSFSKVPAHVNLLLLPENSAGLLNEEQVSVIIQALNEGKISLITSGFTNLSDELGIEKMDRVVTVDAIQDNYFPEIKIQWTPPKKLYLFESPGDSSYIYKDLSTGNPLVISNRLGQGTYMFLAMPLSEEPSAGLDFYPYLLTHIFRSFRLFPLIRQAEAEIYFNPAEREGISIEALIKEWRRSGVGTIYAAAWQVFPEWTYDYERLIRLAHANGMLVYSWFELPYVNDKFWLDHPEWREKNPFGEDVVIGWRKPMAIGDSDCFNAIKKDVKNNLEAYDWDGVVLNRVGWEAPKGVDDPATYTPFHQSVCSDFKRRFGFDPRDLFNPDSKYFFEKNDEALQRFETFRQSGAKEWTRDLLVWMNSLEKGKQNDWEIILTYDKQRRYNGLSLEEHLSLKNSLGLSLQLATDSEKQWETISPPFDMVKLFFKSNPEGHGFHPGAVTSYPTGSALYTLLQGFIEEKIRFSLFSENALFEVDKHLLPFLFSSDTLSKWADDHLSVDTPTSARLSFKEDKTNHMMIDGKSTGSYYNASLLLPAGEHVISTKEGGISPWQTIKSKTRLMDCSAVLLKTVVRSLGLEFTYWAKRRSAIVVNEKPLKISIDGVPTDIKTEGGISGWTMMLPHGKHTVFVKTRTPANMALLLISLIISNTILLISLLAIISLAIILVLTLVRKRVEKSPIA